VATARTKGEGEIKGTMAFDRKEFGMNSGIPFILVKVPVTGQNRSRKPGCIAQTHEMYKKCFFIFLYCPIELVQES